MERTIWFYRDLLGLRMTLDVTVGREQALATLRLPPGTTGRSVYFQGPTMVGQIEAIQWNLPEPADWRPRRPGEPGVFLLAFRIAAKDMAALHRRLIAQEIECFTPPQKSVLDNYGPITIFVCLDPDGNMIEFVSLPSPDEIRAHRPAGGTDSRG